MLSPLVRMKDFDGRQASKQANQSHYIIKQSIQALLLDFNKVFNNNTTFNLCVWIELNGLHGADLIITLKQGNNFLLG